MSQKSLPIRALVHSACGSQITGTGLSNPGPLPESFLVTPGPGPGLNSLLPEGDGDHRYGYFVFEQPGQLDYREEGGPTDSCSPQMSNGRGPFK